MKIIKKAALLLATACVALHLPSFTQQHKEKIKLYILYTPSHTVFKDEWFLPSLQDDFEIIEVFHKQECASGEFHAQGWQETMLKKVDLIIRAIQENWNKVFIHSDVDIQFFAPIEKLILQHIKGQDMVIQRDSPKGQLCAGFFACRGNEKTLNLWKAIRNYMLETGYSDQPGLNRFLKSPGNPFAIQWQYLPPEFFSGGSLTGKRWEPGLHLPIPKNIVLHHANWTKGIENKIAQLQYVRETINKRK